MDKRSFGVLFGPYLPSEHPAQRLFDGVVERQRFYGDSIGYSCRYDQHLVQPR